MSVQVQKQFPPFSQFLVNLVHTCPREQGRETIKMSTITVTDLAEMPKHSQLLVAYCLQQNDPDLTLLNGDTDVESLVLAGWMIAVPCPTVGICSFRFKPNVWNQLRSIRSQFLSNVLAADLVAYKNTKSACYPWNW